jgi:hypothetical protein
VKAIVALALLAVIGFTVTGCGSSKKAGPATFAGVGLPPGANSITVTGNTEISNVKTGTRIKCKGWPGRGVKVPLPGAVANIGGGTVKPNGTKTSRNMHLTRLENGSVRVICTRSH